MLVLAGGMFTSCKKHGTEPPQDSTADTRPFLTPTVINGKVYVSCEDHIGVFFCANETKVN